MSTRLAACLKRHIQPGSRLTVGYSGGLDSSVLLYLLVGLRNGAGFSLSAVHVHHGLSEQADAWAQHCASVCRRLDVPLALHHVDVKPAGEGLEAAARAARYRVYTQLDTDFLALAHHRDDQAETVLLQLLRGASLKGLAAMPEARGLTAKIVLLRPLLRATRSELTTIAAELGLNWIEDASNSDHRLARNSLRLGIMPELAERFPTASRALAQAAEQFAEAAALLDDLADLDGREAMAREGLSIAALQVLPEPRARNLLRRFLEISGVEIHHDALHEALRQLCHARQDAQVCVMFGACALRRHRQWAVVQCSSPDMDVSVLETRVWQGEASINLGENGSLHFQATAGSGVRLAPGEVTIRARVGGERLRPARDRPRRTLKNLWREAGMPVWRRASAPLVYVGETLVWAPEVGADCDFQVNPGETGWLISWQATPKTAA